MQNKSLWGRLKKIVKREDAALVIRRQEHTISRSSISPNALKVLYRLNEMGYSAYLVGGSVRDLLLNSKPKDFDVVTNAHPEEVRKIFRNSRLIGRRFRLVHVYFHDEIIEVSTFRANVEESHKEGFLTKTKGKRPGMLLNENTYGTIEEDAWRRDFTVNAIYYDISDFSVVDYTGGVDDLKKRIIRMIGDPLQRFHEDPVRLLRAIRLAAKLDFKIELHTKEAVLKLGSLLHHVPHARMFDELIKLFLKGDAYKSYAFLDKMGYIPILFPQTDSVISKKTNAEYKQFILLAMQSTDARHKAGQVLNPGFLWGVLLWPVVQQLLDTHQKQGGKFFPALHGAINTVFSEQRSILAIPKRFMVMIRSVWILQYHLEQRRKRRLFRIVNQRYFRAAYDFFMLRVQAGEPFKAQLAWWTEFYKADHTTRQKMVKALK